MTGVWITQPALLFTAGYLVAAAGIINGGGAVYLAMTDRVAIAWVMLANFAMCTLALTVMCAATAAA
jgi:hypothetical protein